MSESTAGGKDRVDCEIVFRLVVFDTQLNKIYGNLIQKLTTFQQKFGCWS